MKKVVATVLWLYGVLAVSAQSGTALTGMNKYTIPVQVKGAEIGMIHTGGKGKIKLVKDTAGLFRIVKGNILCLKNKVQLLPGTGAFRYAVTVAINSSHYEFELVKDEFIHNKVIAHRGAWKNQHVTENTLGSLRKAIELGCEGSEFDVWLSADSIPVVCHNGSIQGKEIEKTTAKELQSIDLKNGDYLPTLEDYLLTIKPQNKTRLFLEIKSSAISQERVLALTTIVVNMVHRLKVQAWVDYISFNYGVLQKIRQLDPQAATAYLTGDKKVEELKKDGITGIDYPFNLFKSDRSLTENTHQLKLSVNAWTVDKKEDIDYLLQNGVDYVTTNEPELMLEMIRKK